MFKKIIISLLVAHTISNLQSNNLPNGDFCGNIFGNSLKVSLNSTTNMSDISANIFGTNYQCLNESYKYNITDKSINMPSNQSDCLNKVLNENGACPCPPEIVYKNNQRIIQNTDLGNIPLNAC